MRLLLFLGFLASAWACPEHCKCMGDTVDCSNKNLLSFPKNVPSTTGTLILRHNRIGRVSADDVRHLTHLHTLLLNDNTLRRVEENFLDVLPSLKRLSIARNRVTFVPPLATGTSDVVSLDLRHNKIEKVDAEAFSSIPHLIQLDLAHNNIQSLPTTLFKRNPSIKDVYLHRNPWNCDCRIAPLANILAKTSPQTVACFNPPQLRGHDLKNVGAHASCMTPTVVEKELHHQLTCPGENRKNVQFFYRGTELDFSLATTYQLTDDGILLLPTDESPEGFTCSSDFAIVPQRFLRQARTQAGQAPQFTFKPRDSSYREGTAVKIHCEVVGEPRPTVNWFYKNQRITPTRKYELTFANSVLKIYPFLEEDVGTYRCEAVNVHGRIQHSARLQLISSVPPSIYDTPTSQTVELGQQVTFRCRARGVPRPDITWFFDGSIIPHIRGRLMVSDDGSELTVTRVGRQDDGTFSCMAGNSVGAMMADARLKVKGDFDKTVDSFLTDDTIKNIAIQAKANVEREVEKTRTRLSQDAVTNPNDLKRLFRFSIPAQAVELSKAREIYEESIRLVHEHVQKGMRLPVSLLAPNVSYEAVLSVSHVQTLMELSGCQTGQVLKDSCSDMCFHSKYRAYDGQCNNLEHPMWGVSSMPLQRLIPPIYENGFNTPVGWEKGRLYNGYPKPNPREISRQLVATHSITPHSHLSAMVMQWGQFVDHDLTHTAMALARSSYASGAICNRTCENLDPCFNIPLTANDPKLHTGVHVKYPCIEFERSGAVCGSGETSLVFQRVTYRDQLNIITSFLDGSVVYGSSEAQALELRDLFGDHGQMRFDIVSSAQKPYMPFEKDSDMDCKRNFSQENPIRCFLAGDLRANEQLGLTSMHTLFIREHNRIAGKLLEINVNWDGETIFQETRKIVTAMIQHITYKEWLPTVLGKTGFNELIGEYGGYNPEVNPSIANAFATAAFRFGHTLINPTLFRLDKDFKPTKDGHLPLHKAFFAPERLLSEGGIDPLLRGLFASPLKLPRSSQLLNTELTEKLFGRFHEVRSSCSNFNNKFLVALDLAVMNIQRGRDHGLPGYVEYRRFCNLSVPQTWDDFSSIVTDSGVRQKLRGLYGHPDNIDLWVGGVVEERLPDALMGPTFACIIADQFKRLRDGDRFWYENDDVFNKNQLQQIRKTSLAKLFCDNGDDIDRVQRNVFFYPGNSTLLYEKCERHPSINLNIWTHCCESSSCAVNDSNNSRKRRSHHHRKDCEVDGGLRKDGLVWHPEKCTVCKCEDGKVWCSVKKNCST